MTDYNIYKLYDEECVYDHICIKNVDVGRFAELVQEFNEFTGESNILCFNTDDFLYFITEYRYKYEAQAVVIEAVYF